MRDGRFAADLRATVRDIGDVRGRKGEFKWRLTGRFVAADVVRATVTRHRRDPRARGPRARALQDRQADLGSPDDLRH